MQDLGVAFFVVVFVVLPAAKEDAPSPRLRRHKCAAICRQGCGGWHGDAGLFPVFVSDRAWRGILCLRQPGAHQECSCSQDRVDGSDDLGAAP